MLSDKVPVSYQGLFKCFTYIWIVLCIVRSPDLGCSEYPTIKHSDFGTGAALLHPIT